MMSQAQIDTVLKLFQEAGHLAVDPPILQPANTFLDLTGEDIRRRLFLTNGPDGSDLCLRPDFTIPVCRQHLERGDAGRRADYCYSGPVFRQRAQGSGEIPQLGAESLGRDDRDEADADMLGLAVAALDALGVGERDIIIGDETLFASVLSGLDLPAVWQRRLRDLFGETDKLSAAIDRMAGADRSSDDTRDVRLGFLAALEGADPEAAHAVVEDLLSIAGISAVGGRTPSEIADRFLEQAALANGSGNHARAAEVLKSFLAIRGNAADSVSALETFAGETGLDLGEAIAGYKNRLDAIRGKGIDPADLTFAADFGRRLDYYTGFVFEIHSRSTEAGGQLVGGGRYDRLVKLLGAGTEVPAIGFSIWLDRIAKLSGRSQ
jgi:ATP phosphoribosyltransferase regulatory subunit